MTARSTVVFLTLTLGLSVGAQVPATSVPRAGPNGVPADVRATPRSAVFGFLQACRQGEYRQAASFLDIRGGRRGADAEQLAREFKEVLDRKLTTDPATLSNSSEGNLADGLDPKFDLLGTVQVGGRPIDLLLERVSREEGVPVWLVSSGTVHMIPMLHDELGDAWVETVLPSWLLVRGPLETPVWIWLGLLILTGAALGFARLFALIIVHALRPIVRRTPSELDDQLMASMVKPVRLLIALAIFRTGLVWVTPAVLLRSYLGRILTGLTYLALAWLAMRVIDIIATRVVVGMTGRQRASASSVVPLLRRTAKVAAVLFALLATLSSWGYNTTALLAGLGVGGLAIALAAQKTIENLFGGVALTTDKPVLVGDFCRYGDHFGVVEDIGLRSTRIRTLDRTLVTIPNGQFSALEIENFGRRDKIFFHPILKLRLDTNPDQVRSLIQGLRQILLNTPKVDPDPARVRFIGISEYSLDLEIFSYVKTTDFDEFLILQEELLLQFLDLIEQSGTSLALPSRLTLLSRDRPRPVSREQSHATEPGRD